MNKFQRLLSTVVLIAMAAAAPAEALNIKPFYQDIKLPTQAVLEHQSWAGPIVATASQLISGGSLTTGQANTLSTFAHQPDFARNVTITPTGTTANVGACTAVVNGTDLYGAALTENFSISSTQSTATTGNKAFNTLTSVVFPSACTTGSGVTVNVGVGSKLGLKRCMANAGGYVFSVFNGAYESTRGTAVGTTQSVSQNTFVPNGTMDGSKVVDLYFIQDFSCFP